MRVALPIAVFVALAVLAGCDSKPKEPPPDILKAQRQPLERAKGVEQGLDEAAKKRMEEADRQAR